jgi:hypothetical protein
LCEAPYADCDKNPANGCETNTTMDVGNCGACGVVCSIPNATPQCNGGVCSCGGCTPGFFDCDGNCANGCETNTNTDPNNCGACGNVCVLQNATAACVQGSCAIATCKPGYLDCDGSPANGCEIDGKYDPNDCGSCGHTCTLPPSKPVCENGGCFVPGYCTTFLADCDGIPANGCETSVAFDVNNCGMCYFVCTVPNATPACTWGKCTIGMCNPGYLDCNASPSDGCEVDGQTDPGNCGMCGNACAAGHLCVGGACN